MAMGQRRRTAAEIWPHRAGHPLEIFQRGRAGKANGIGDTEEAFNKARSLLWAAPDLLAACKKADEAFEAWNADQQTFLQFLTAMRAVRAAIAKAQGGR